VKHGFLRGFVGLPCILPSSQVSCAYDIKKRSRRYFRLKHRTLDKENHKTLLQLGYPPAILFLQTKIPKICLQYVKSILHFVRNSMQRMGWSESEQCGLVPVGTGLGISSLYNYNSTRLAYHYHLSLATSPKIHKFLLYHACSPFASNSYSLLGKTKLNSYSFTCKSYFS